MGERCFQRAAVLHAYDVMTIITSGCERAVERERENVGYKSGRIIASIISMPYDE